MFKVKILDDPEEFRSLWKRHWPDECVFDHWELRKCFADIFNRKNIFIVIESGRRLIGMLPLSWLEETHCYNFFPGETWQGKTWIEQNRICAADARACRMLLENIPGELCIRYLHPSVKAIYNTTLVTDEFNYAFLPGQFNYSFDGYIRLFSGKSRKRLDKELSRFDRYGVSFRYDNFPDLDIMFALNKNTYGKYSYFYDERFIKSFSALAAWLRDKKMLRITSAIIGGKVAAVDMGAVWKGTYTLLAGGTHLDFPGVAKLINFHHIKWACAEKMGCADFMCGDFGWKQRFHLTARPLYKIHIPEPEHRFQTEFSFNRNNLAYVV